MGAGFEAIVDGEDPRPRPPDDIGKKAIENDRPLDYKVSIDLKKNISKQGKSNGPNLTGSEPDLDLEKEAVIVDIVPSNEKTYIPSEVIIKLNDESINEKELARTHSLDIISSTKSSVLAKIDENESLTDKINSLMEDDRVSYAEPNYIYRATFIPNDPYYNNNWPGNIWGKQWGPQKIGSPAAWDITTGTPSSIVAVIDTGVDYTHPELIGRVINGWDFSNNDTDSIDDNGHGSHVAGIIAANGHNNIGIAGTSWNSKILAIKSLNSSGTGSLIDVADSIIYAADNGADIINLSLAGSSYSQTLQDAVDYAHGMGSVIIAAVGNDGSTLLNYPAGLNNVIGVGATNQSDVRAHFSNFNSSVDISAPGVSISSLGSTPLGYTYAIMSGTSMATPFVSGVASLINSIRPNWTPDQIERRLTEAASDLGVTGRDDYYGWGRLDAYEAIFETPDLLEIVSVDPKGAYNPLLGSVLIGYELTDAADIYVNIINGKEEVVKSLGPISSDIGSGSILWDGKDESQTTVEPGWYSLDLYARTLSGAVNKRVVINIDDAQSLLLGAPFENRSSFNPQAGEMVVISTTISKESLLGMVIYDSSRDQVNIFPLEKRSLIGTSSFIWDGRNSYGSLVSSGVYDYFIIGIDPGGNSSVVNGSVTVGL